MPNIFRTLAYWMKTKFYVEIWTKVMLKSLSDKVEKEVGEKEIEEEEDMQGC